jgi:putative ABC transport system permease protein
MAQEYAGYEGWHAGDTITYGVFGGHVRTARIAAIFDGGQTLPPVILPEGSIGAPPPTAQIRLRDGAPAPEITKRIAAKLPGDGITVTETGAALSAGQQQQDHVNWIGLLILAAPASVYAIIGIAGIIVMAASRRRPEISVMRLLGLTRFQVLRLAFWEALGTTFAGTVLAAGLIAFGLTAFHASVPTYGGNAPLSVPWTLLLTVAGGCLGTNLIVSLLSTAHLLRGRRPAVAE